MPDNDAPTLLSGGNPRIAKGEGQAPIDAYIAAAPGWKAAVVRRLDELVTAAVPDVRKAVKWNSPFYGAPGDEGWFLAVHLYTRSVKVAFFTGAELEPEPPIFSKQGRVRYLHVAEGAGLDEAQFTDWVKQASERPGEMMGGRR